MNTLPGIHFWLCGLSLLTTAAAGSYWLTCPPHVACPTSSAEMSPGQAEGSDDHPNSDDHESPIPPADESLVLSFNFQGSLPIMAWSPDGSRLVMSAAYHGRPSHEIERYRDSLGLWVYERDTGTINHLLDEQRYYPVWIGNDLVASACASTEECTPGLYLSHLDGQYRLAQEGDVLNTASQDDHRLLFYRDGAGWGRYDLDSSMLEPGISTAGPWEAPVAVLLDQCIQQVGDLRVFVDEATGLWVQMGDDAPALLDTWLPYRCYHCQGNGIDDHGTLVAPCLAPDGRQVAYIAYREGLSGEGEGEALYLFLRIHALAATAEEASAFPEDDP